MTEEQEYESLRDETIPDLVNMIIKLRREVERLKPYGSLGEALKILSDNGMGRFS